SDTFVVGLLGEPVRWADARAATAVLSLVALAGHDLVLAVHPSAQRRFEAQRYAESLGIGHRIVLDEELAEPWRMVSGLDAGLLMSDETTSARPRRLGSPLGILLGGGRPRRPMTGTMSLLWAAAAGIPVVAEGTLAARAFVEEGITGFLVGSRDIYRAANRLVRLVEDRQLAGRVGAAAAVHVRQADDVSAFCVRLKTVWERLCDERPMLILGDPAGAHVEFVPPERRARRIEANTANQR
ncbi:MAG: glycosyltransferase, partial [Phycisphaerales bacterium]|nr:glycosyltransferase [Phycisphaerales bacterium]